MVVSCKIEGLRCKMPTKDRVCYACDSKKLWRPQGWGSAKGLVISAEPFLSRFSAGRQHALSRVTVPL